LTVSLPEFSRLYLEYQDKLYKGKTYKEPFLTDIFTLKKAGITHPDFEKAKDLLKQ